MSEDEEPVVEKFASDSWTFTELPAKVRKLYIEVNGLARAILAVLTIGPPVVSLVMGDLVNAAIGATISLASIGVGFRLLRYRLE